ncbi:hypothetical protein LguiA_024348 [Lonicera macranthoides]
MGKIPYQCLFNPSDHGLIRDFLNPKLRGEALMYDDAVFELERHYIYGGKTPWDIFYATIQQENEDAVYLFTTPPGLNENNASTVFESGGLQNREDRRLVMTVKWPGRQGLLIDGWQILLKWPPVISR